MNVSWPRFAQFEIDNFDTIVFTLVDEAPGSYLRPTVDAHDYWRKLEHQVGPHLRRGRGGCGCGRTTDKHFWY